MGFRQRAAKSDQDFLRPEIPEIPLLDLAALAVGLVKIQVCLAVNLFLDDVSHAYNALFYGSVYKNI
jgi:hypothetical protein